MPTTPLPTAFPAGLVCCSLILPQPGEASCRLLAAAVLTDEWVSAGEEADDEERHVLKSNDGDKDRRDIAHSRNEIAAPLLITVPCAPPCASGPASACRPSIVRPTRVTSISHPMTVEHQ